jgi:hypothetical protein
VDRREAAFLMAANTGNVAAYLYPWDVVGDPAAPALIAGLGLDHVVLAAVYHGVRALTPRHPRHRVVVAPRTATYYPGRDAAGWMDSADPFGEASAALRDAGVPVHAWIVCDHVDGSTVDGNVVNAFGDTYPWALCPAQPTVNSYLVRLAEEVASLPGIAGVELEACGWYGFDHLSAHDKVGGLSPAQKRLLSLCFCGACADLYRDGGVDPTALRVNVRTSFDAGSDQILASVSALRQGVADDLRAAMTAKFDVPVVLHASPDVDSSSSFTGVDPSKALESVDGLVVNCWHGLDQLRPGFIASLLAVRGLGGRSDLVEQASAALTAGAAGIRLYHAGLASDADLAAIRALTTRLGE